MFERAQNDAYRVEGSSRALPAVSADRNALCAQRDKGSKVCLATKGANNDMG